MQIIKTFFYYIRLLQTGYNKLAQQMSQNTNKIQLSIKPIKHLNYQSKLKQCCKEDPQQMYEIVLVPNIKNKFFFNIELQNQNNTTQCKTKHLPCFNQTLLRLSKLYCIIVTCFVSQISTLKPAKIDKKLAKKISKVIEIQHPKIIQKTNPIQILTEHPNFRLSALNFCSLKTQIVLTIFSLKILYKNYAKQFFIIVQFYYSMLIHSLIITISQYLRRQSKFYIKFRAENWMQILWNVFS
eukprot:TRINITY_DN2826_c0_g1_i1.p2 TRINITY_DN2826_c0_g1~~TRINITY_DN2826_c0_g1_i1.p2  ORF type:complete len:240 (+),score=-14.80 TRINITY_DN2826_c0_g1_i1:809-1528(+)